MAKFGDGIEKVFDQCGIDDEWSNNWRTDGKETVKQARAEEYIPAHQEDVYE